MVVKPVASTLKTVVDVAVNLASINKKPVPSVSAAFKASTVLAKAVAELVSVSVAASVVLEMAAPPSVTVRPPAVTVSPPAVTVAPPLTTLKPPAVTVAPPALTLSPPAAMVVKPVASTLKTVVDVAVNLASINKKPVPSVSAAFKASTVLAKAVAELVSVSVAASVVLEMAAPPSVTVSGHIASTLKTVVDVAVNLASINKKPVPSVSAAFKASTVLAKAVAELVSVSVAASVVLEMAAPPSVTVRPPAVTVSPPAVTVAPPALTLSPPAAMVVKPVASTLKTVVDVAVNLASINKKPVPSVSAAFKVSTVLAKAVAELVSVSVAASVVLEMAAPPSVTVRPPAVTVSPPAVTVAPPLTTLKPPAVTVAPPALTLSPPAAMVVKPVASTLKTVVDVAVNLASINKKPVPSVSAAFKASTVLAKAAAELVSVSVLSVVPVSEIMAPPLPCPAMVVNPDAATVNTDVAPTLPLMNVYCLSEDVALMDSSEPKNPELAVLESASVLVVPVALSEMMAPPLPWPTIVVNPDPSTVNTDVAGDASLASINEKTVAASVSEEVIASIVLSKLVAVFVSASVLSVVPVSEMMAPPLPSPAMVVNPDAATVNTDVAPTLPLMNVYCLSEDVALMDSSEPKNPELAVLESASVLVVPVALSEMMAPPLPWPAIVVNPVASTLNTEVANAPTVASTR
ncbi:hypothetical protein GN958_ATG12390 [Phytophthora infestans]|uniref:Uncharacterized protein n=1 Tax=Phytophthora infestans TaxID=4787 RepID=A0A8S9UGP7_PHYIN|nr:hypothetical protein GN958_ATG12390 [Phytophthora infestans]